jgi:hypothetical protein
VQVVEQQALAAEAAVLEDFKDLLLSFLVQQVTQ